jgi:hypothetical protein
MHKSGPRHLYRHSPRVTHVLAIAVPYVLANVSSMSWPFVSPMSWHRSVLAPPLQHPYPLRRVQFQIGASLHHSITPSLHHSITPSLQHSITPRGRIRGQLVRRSPSSVLSTAQVGLAGEARSTTRTWAKSEGRRRGRRGCWTEESPALSSWVGQKGDLIEFPCRSRHRRSL